MRLARAAGLVMAIASLCACAALPGAGPAAPATRADPQATRSDPAAASGAGAELPGDAAISGPSAALLDLSREQRQSGDLGGAAATIERALTIEPDQALLWVELAEIRLDQGDPALAEEMARKALTLTRESSATAARARQLIRR